MSDQADSGFWPFVLPLLVYLLISPLEPRFPTPAVEDPAAVAEKSEIELDQQFQLYQANEQRQIAYKYLIIYGIKILLTAALLACFWKTYLGDFPFSISPIAVAVGGMGIVVWVGLCQIGIESRLLDYASGENSLQRSQFDPFTQLTQQWQLLGFLATRFIGLVIIVPICEELFLRGFLMRFVQSADFRNVKLSQLGLKAMLVAPVYGALTHPTEALAAIAWFSLVTWLVRRTGKFWDAVIAHAVTNLLLGVYVCLFSQWQLW